jgi:hypothetical protein
MSRAAASLFAVFLFTSVLAACETPLPAQKIPDITFQNLTPIKLAVAKVEVSSTYRSPLSPPNVEYLFPTPPETALRTWAADRLRAEGGADVAKFIISNASVIDTKLKTRKGIVGAFFIEQSERYDAAVEADILILDGNGKQKAFATARASRSTTVAENVSLGERQRIQFKLIEALMKDFNIEMEKNVRRYLANWIR